MQLGSNLPTSPLLGISAKSSNASVVKPKPQTAIEAKKLKYTLQRTAQNILYDTHALKQHRVCSCHRNVASDGVAVYRETTGENARFGNVISCGSTWSCPICAGRITEVRREDMQKAQNAWLMQGGACLLNTLTFPHEYDIPLSELLEKFAKALDYYKNSRTYKRIFGTAVATIEWRIQKKKEPLKKTIVGEFPRLGTVRSLEVTHGVNGWHPHVHEVLFMDDAKLLEAQRAKDELTKEWVMSLLKAGLGSREKMADMFLHAWDVRGGDYVSDYINKFGREPIEVNGWTIAHEVTKANAKMGRKARKIGTEWHYTPFQLLGFATDGDEQAAALFKEFSQCFEGKRMNYWTNGLKDYFGINDIEDEEAADEMDEAAPKEEFVVRLNTEQWRQILRANARWACLQAAALGLSAMEEFLERLPTLPKVSNGLFLDHVRIDPYRLDPYRPTTHRSFKHE